MLFGAGLASIVEYLSARDWLARTRLSSSVVLAAGSLVAVAALYPRYLGREAFTRAAQMSRESAAGADRMAYDWIVTRTSRGTVFLASDIDALRVVAPAGRSVVSVVPEFSNPYVDYQRRAAMKSALESALDSGDAATFMRLSRAAGVTHVLLRDADRNAALRRGAMPLREVFRSGSLSVFEVATTP
jgi:hypothetical protein